MIHKNHDSAPVLLVLGNLERLTARDPDTHIQYESWGTVQPSFGVDAERTLALSFSTPIPKCSKLARCREVRLVPQARLEVETLPRPSSMRELARKRNMNEPVWHAS